VLNLRQLNIVWLDPGGDVNRMAAKLATLPTARKLFAGSAEC
jgi:hypothetical protein